MVTEGAVCAHPEGLVVIAWGEGVKALSSVWWRSRCCICGDKLEENHYVQPGCTFEAPERRDVLLESVSLPCKLSGFSKQQLGVTVLLGVDGMRGNAGIFMVRCMESTGPRNQAETYGRGKIVSHCVQLSYKSAHV